MKTIILGLLLMPAVHFSFSQEVSPPARDLRMNNIVNEISSARIEKDIKTLVSFGTRNTFSDTVSQTRGIGAARRWVKAQFDQVSKDCNQCLTVFYQSTYITKEGNSRVPKDDWIVNVIAIQKGSLHPDHYVIMSGDIDSRASDVMDYTTDAPGANDNASGMAGTLEAARVLSKYSFANSIVYMGLSGEEQGLYGGKYMAAYAKEHGWKIIGMLNNDMIGNIEGVDSVIDNREFRIFSEPVPFKDTEQDRIRLRYMGGEVDGISRQLARYVLMMTSNYMPEMKPMLIYRIDRFGRGGHEIPFNDAGYAAVRIMEAHENYYRQHQNVRVENGIHYGDVIDGVNFNYCAKLTAANAITLAGLAWAPPAPENVAIGGAVSPDTKLKWDEINDPDMAGYKIYWRETTAPQWKYFRYVKDVNEYTLKGIVIDNYYFGVASVNKNGDESVVSFPLQRIR